MGDGIDDHRAQEHSWCPRCGVLDGPVFDGLCDVCLTEDRKEEDVEYFARTADHAGAVDALRTVMDRLGGERVSQDDVFAAHEAAATALGLDPYATRGGRA